LFIASSDHFFALSILLSFQNIFATAQFIAESVPQFYIATLAFFFLVLEGYMMMAIPHIYPLFGHSFSAFDKVVPICFLFPALT